MMTRKKMKSEKYAVIWASSNSEAAGFPGRFGGGSRHRRQVIRCWEQFVSVGGSAEQASKGWGAGGGLKGEGTGAGS